jgi:hypothetical protein
MELLLIIVVLLILFGGGGYWYSRTGRGACLRRRKSTLDSNDGDRGAVPSLAVVTITDGGGNRSIGQCSATVPVVWTASGEQAKGW